MTQPILNPDRIDKILGEALAPSGRPIEGVMRSFAVDCGVVAQHRAEIVAMLGELPDEFMDNGGGGWSFLNLCQDRHGHLWTGMHSTCEALIVLAEALDLASYMLPRDMWDALPGGMPYVAFKRSAWAATAA